MNYWWVSQGKYFKKENPGGYMEARQIGKKGGDAPPHWKNIRKVKKGDYIFSYVGGFIKAIGIACGDPVTTQKSPNTGKNRPGCRVNVSWTNLDKPFRTKDVWDSTKHLFEYNGKPLNYKGGGCQKYLSQITEEIFVTYLDYIKKNSGTDLSKFAVG